MSGTNSLDPRLYRRILRRERFGSRSTAVVVVLVLVVVGLAYVGVECVLSALGRPPLLVSPDAALAWTRSDVALVPIIATVAALLAIVLLIVALTPGRRARHVLPSERIAVVVDDSVIAGALAREARLAAQVAATRVHADVSARRARILVTPTTGVAVDSEATAAVVTSALDALDPRPRIRATTRIASTGRVGS